jgi:dihydrofolate synthase/folylpolyglutamate synthase
MEFGVLSAEAAVGGQLLTLQGLGGAYEEVFLPLFGAHQAQNAAQALAAVEVFFGAGAGRKLDVDVVREAFATVTSPGRLERVRTAPSVFIDAAHNPHGARALATALQDQFAFQKVVGVLSVMEDKDVDGILAALEPVFTEVVLTDNGSPRAMDADKLAGLARDVFGEDRIVVEPRLDDALEEAVRLAEETDGEPVSTSGVVVTGSVVTAGAARAMFGKEPQ